MTSYNNGTEKTDVQEMVGYIRVSTERQEREGNSLNEQVLRLGEFCWKRGVHLPLIHQDNCSAAGRKGHILRDGLRLAISEAEKRGVPLLVPSIDRLARDPAIYDELVQSGLPVWSASEGGLVGRRRLKRLLVRAKQERDDIASRAREGAAKAKRRGVRLGNPTNLPVAQKRGTVGNMLRADRKALELGEFIKKVPRWDTLTLREKVDLLNREGPKNLVSERTLERKDWTLQSLRQPLERARTLMEERRAIEEASTEDLKGVQISNEPGPSTISGSDTSAPEQTTDATKKRSKPRGLKVAPQEIILPQVNSLRQGRGVRIKGTDSEELIGRPLTEQEQMDEFYKDNPLYGKF